MAAQGPASCRRPVTRISDCNGTRTTPRVDTGRPTVRDGVGGSAWATSILDEACGTRPLKTGSPGGGGGSPPVVASVVAEPPGLAGIATMRLVPDPVDRRRSTRFIQYFTRIGQGRARELPRRLELRGGTSIGSRCEFPGRRRGPGLRYARLGSSTLCSTTWPRPDSST